MRTRRHILTAGLSVTALGFAAPALASRVPPAAEDVMIFNILKSVRIHAVVGDAEGNTHNLKKARRFATINEALEAAPADQSRYGILVGKGIFREKLKITRDNVTLSGLSPEASVIVYDDYAGKPDGKGGTLGTSGSETLSVLGKGVHLLNLSIVNDFDFNAHATLPEDDPKKTNGTQAVALKLWDRSDKALLINVTLTGHQDTLFVNSGRTLVLNSRISGCVDFIFGAGTAVFKRCQIISDLRGQGPDQGYVAAPSTLSSTPYGLIFLDCNLVSEGANFPPESVALARPWRPTTTFPDGRYGNPDAIGSAIFARCKLGAHISASGFTSMTYGRKDGQRTALTPQEVRFAAVDCTGPSAEAIGNAYPFPADKIKDLTPENLLGLSGWKV